MIVQFNILSNFSFVVNSPARKKAKMPRQKCQGKNAKPKAAHAQHYIIIVLRVTPQDMFDYLTHQWGDR